MTYTTQESVALFLNISPDSLTDIEKQQIDMLISHVDGVIDNYCGYTLAAKDYVDKRFDGSGLSTLDLGIFPVNSVTSVTEIDSSGNVLDDTPGIELLEDGVIQFLASVGGTFTAGSANVYVTFNAGYTEIPADIAFAATYLVALNFNRISQDLIGITRQEATGLVTEYDSVELPLLVKRVLDRYRKLSIF